MKIPGYQHYRTSVVTELLSLFIVKLTAQSPIVENNQQNNNTNNVVETTIKIKMK